MEDLVQGVLEGRQRAVARMLSVVENNRPGMDEALAALYPHTGRAWVIGVTGAPGTGKSSLVNALTRIYRGRDQKVGIVAVDPTSPFTGGALLGDRIRMNDHSGDPGVFIRSMATRGSLGGLARATRDSVRVLDAAGYDIVFVETVGAGQSEVDIARTAYTTLVVEAPGLGDDVQAIKAGILEIADILVVNKSDRPGADQSARALRAMLDLGHPAARERISGGMASASTVDESQGDFWLPPVLRTVASDGSGVEELVATIDRHRTYLLENDRLHRLQSRYIEIELVERLQHELLARLNDNIPQADMQAAIEAIRDRRVDPQSAARDLLDHVR